MGLSVCAWAWHHRPGQRISICKYRRARTGHASASRVWLLFWRLGIHQRVFVVRAGTYVWYCVSTHVVSHPSDT
jgi:hypothetical protein